VQTAEGDWIVNGQKVWSTLAADARFGMLLARTDPTVAKHAGITYFAIDLQSPGVDVRPLVQMTGESEFCEVFIDDVRIPDLHRISPIGEGWAASTTTLLAERVTLSGNTTKQRSTKGVLGGKTIDEVLDRWASQSALARDPVLRDRVADAYIQSRVLALTVERASVNRASAVNSVTKLSKSRTNQQLQLLAMSMLGAGAIAWEHHDAESPSFVKEFLRTRANSIEGGTSEIQRNILGERVLGLPREPDPYAGKPWNEVPRS
jgi:alkylation response protein AidB-like acyl-CoA dehydrogenase